MAAVARNIFISTMVAMEMERSLLLSLTALMLLSVLDNIVGTIVGPSLIFYIESLGGTKDDYGLTTSAAFLGMTLMMFYFGKWIDSNGNKYQAPLACAFILGIVGSIIYFLASVLPSGFWAVHAVLLGRFMQGMGAAGKILSNSWIATAIPLENQKTVITILTMVSMAGQVLGPPLNVLVAEINTSVAITPSYSIPINPYNSVGLLVTLNEVVIWAIIAFFLKDPPSQKKSLARTSSNADPTTATEADPKDILTALTHFDIFFPIIQQFVMVANFMMFGVATAPVAANMLDWTPVEISKLSVAQAVVSFLGMTIMMYLSLRNTSDFTMIFVGNGIFTVSGFLTYLQWRTDTATVLTFALPILLTCLVYPFTGPANQSSFNKAVFSRPEIAGSIGVLQSIYAQGATVAGIVAPG